MVEAMSSMGDKPLRMGCNSVSFLEDDDLDIGEELPINVSPQLTKKK